MPPTKKLFYIDPYRTSCRARITEVTQEGIVTDQTIAFPEGGGQEGDRGTIHVPALSMTIPFSDTIKGLGRPIYLDDFPLIQVDTPIVHVVPECELKHLQAAAKGIDVEIVIDVQRRANLTASHTSIHLVLMAIERIRPGIYSAIRGCHIGELQSRLDFKVAMRFSREETEQICLIANSLVDQDIPIFLFPHENEPEAWFWKCDSYTIPCGGLHLQTTGQAGHQIIKRSNLGKNLERIATRFPEAKPPLGIYHLQNQEG